MPTILDELEQPNRCIALPVGRPSHEQDVLQTGNLDDAIHAQVGSRARRKGAVERDVDRHGPGGGGGVDPAHLARGDPVPGIDLRPLADRDAVRLRFGNAEHGLEPERRGHHAREHRAGVRVLADLQRHFLEHPVGPGPDHHRGLEPMLELGDRPQPLHLALLDFDLLVDRLGQDLEALFLVLHLLTEGGGTVLRLLLVERDDEPLLEQLGARLGATLRIEPFLAPLGNGGCLGEPVAAERGLELHQLRFGVGEGTVGVERLNLDVGIRKLEDDRLGLDAVAGQQMEPLNTAGGDGRDPARVLRHERPGPANLDDHVALLHGIEPRRFDGWGRGLEIREREGHGQEPRADDPSDNPLLSIFRRLALDVHGTTLAEEAVARWTQLRRDPYRFVV